MSTAMNFGTRNDSFRKLMGNGLTYQIPRFQSDYSWTLDEWEDLWTDILGTVADGGEPAHYMGYLVLQSDDDRMFRVIDGQQRLTTLSLIVLSVLKHLQRLVDAGVEADGNRIRFEQIRQSYIGVVDPVSLVPQLKLKLNRNNDRYYQSYLVPLVDKLPQRGGFRASELSLRRAFEWFDRQVGEYAKSFGTDQGKALAALVDRMSDRLLFTVITVTNELNAYKVFETLNARGVRLSTTDLLKNYLFSVMSRRDQHEHEFNLLEERWEDIVERLGSEDFPIFLRTHWISRRGPVRQNELFKAIRGKVGDPNQVFALLSEIEDDLETYLALTEPESSAWPRSMKSAASTLLRFGVRQPYPLLLAAHKRFNEQDFGQILDACVVISFRYNVIGGLSTGDQQSAYNSAIRRMIDGELTRAIDVIRALAPIYPTDDHFRETFAEKVIRPSQPRGTQIVRYILCKIEQQLEGVEVNLDSDTLSIEHVLPRNAEAGWDSFLVRDADSFVYRLGNMTLLESGKNKKLGNADYAAKREIYARSKFHLTRGLAEHNADWTPQRLDDRQEWMAKQATTIWSLAQLSRVPA